MEEKIFKNKSDFIKNATDEDYKILLDRYNSLERKKDFDIKYFSLYGFKYDSCRIILKDKNLIEVQTRTQNKKSEVIENMKTDLILNPRLKLELMNKSFLIDKSVNEKLNKLFEQYPNYSKSGIFNHIILEGVEKYLDNTEPREE